MIYQRRLSKICV
jgi:hypothetical protein